MSANKLSELFKIPPPATQALLASQFQLVEYMHRYGGQELVDVVKEHIDGAFTQKDPDYMGQILWLILTKLNQVELLKLKDLVSSLTFTDMQNSFGFYYNH
jgi:hypothetical protein